MGDGPLGFGILPSLGIGGPRRAVRDYNGEAVYIDCPRHGTRQPPTYKAFGGRTVFEAWEAKKFRYASLNGRHMAALKATGMDHDRRKVLDVLGIDHKKGAIGWCPDCHGFVRARITKPKPISALHPFENNGKCGGACLSGRYSCSCTCAGFCHGAGHCRCGNPTESTRRKGLVAVL